MSQQKPGKAIMFESFVSKTVRTNDWILNNVSCFLCTDGMTVCFHIFALHAVETTYMLKFSIVLSAWDSISPNDVYVDSHFWLMIASKMHLRSVF